MSSWPVAPGLRPYPITSTCSTHNTTQALARAREELRALPEVEAFLTFFETSERGVTV